MILDSHLLNFPPKVGSAVYEDCGKMVMVLCLWNVAKSVC